MTSKDIADALVARRGMSKAEARETVAMVLEEIATGIAKGDASLAGFGKFSVSRRGARPGRNPRSGETIVLGPTARVGFKAAKALKDRLAGR